MTCTAYRQRLDELEDYLGGRLEASRAEAVSAHVATCAECREALESAALGTRLVRAGAEPVAAASAPFWTRLRALVRAEEERRSRRRDFLGALEWLAWRTASAAVMLVVLLTGYVMVQPARPDQIDQQTEVFPEPEHPRNVDEVLVTLAARPSRE